MSANHTWYGIQQYLQQCCNVSRLFWSLHRNSCWPIYFFHSASRSALVAQRSHVIDAPFKTWHKVIVSIADQDHHRKKQNRNPSMHQYPMLDFHIGRSTRDHTPSWLAPVQQNIWAPGAAAIEEIELQENFESHQSGLCLLLWLRSEQWMEVRCRKCNADMLWPTTARLETEANIIKNSVAWNRINLQSLTVRSAPHTFNFVGSIKNMTRLTRFRCLGQKLFAVLLKDHPTSTNIKPTSGPSSNEHQRKWQCPHIQVFDLLTFQLLSRGTQILTFTNAPEVVWPRKNSGTSLGLITWLCSPDIPWHVLPSYVKKPKVWLTR